ncbi:MAG: cytochrome c1 [Thiolinea sp.]
MKKVILTVMFALVAAAPLSGLMASETVELEKADIDLHNKSSLQRGAKYFVNYCMGCHSLKFSRYNRVAKDLGLTDDQVADNLIFTRTEGETTKVGELMKNGMTAKYGEQAFGAAPPDLSLVGRSRGGDWIYSFLKAFYLDPARPLGVNNAVFANAGMPHVLWELQGWQEMEKHDNGHGHVTQELKLVEPGQVAPAEYNQIVRDITNFLVYVGEPAQLHRKGIGIWVMLFLAMFAVLAYFLKKEYWKDVH